MPELWPHQALAIEKSDVLNDLAILAECGTGKTRIAIEILRKKYNLHKRILRTLILGPSVTIRQWKREFGKYSNVPSDKILCLDKAGPQRAALFSKTTQAHPLGFIAITNYEAVPTKSLYPLLVKWAPEIIIYDELHRCKDPQSVRFKHLKTLAKTARHRFGLTGTPILNSPLDLFAQYMLLDLGKTFGDNFYAFRSTYLYDKNSSMPRHVYFPNWVPRKDMEPVLSALLQKTAVQAKKKECLNLPPVVEIEIPVSLGKDQLEAYSSMLKTYIAQIKDAQGQTKAVVANLAITQTLRMREILSGFVRVDGGKVIYFKENPRLDDMLEKLEEILISGAKAIIWTDFVATYSLIQDALTKKGISSVKVTGEENTTAKKDESVLKFTKGDIQVIVANPQAAGLGVELTEAAYSFYYSRSYSQEHRIQSAARNERGGSEMHQVLTRYDMVAEIEGAKNPTLDRVILDCLKLKGELSDSLLAWANVASGGTHA